MIGVALRIVLRRDWAEDVVHDTFVQIWRKADTFDPVGGSARGWIYTILRNLSLNMRRDRSHEEATEDERLEVLAEPQIDARQIYDRLDDRGALKRCLEELDARRRESIVMAYAGGYSHGEIAGRLGVPLGTVKAWIRRSLTALRDCLA